MKYTLRIIGIIGALVFGLAFFFTFNVPGVVEVKAQEFIKYKIEFETNKKIDSLSLAASDSTLGRLASKLLKNQEMEIVSLKSKLKEKTYERTAAVVAFLWLCDVVFNKAQVTSKIVNVMLNAVGSVLHAVPC